MIYVFFAPGFEEIEGLCVVDILRRAELDVATVGIGGKQITGSHGITITTDRDESEISLADLTAVVLPGGMPGTLNLEKSPVVQECIRFAYDRKLCLAAICAAPSILGHMGLLSGRRATCFPGFEEQLTGAVIQPDLVVEDDFLLTGKGPGAALEFGLAIAARHTSLQTAEKIRMSMQCGR